MTSESSFKNNTQKKKIKEKRRKGNKNLKGDKKQLESNATAMEIF